MQQPAPEPDTSGLEQRQLRRSRSGFLLIGAGLLLSFLVAWLAVLWSDRSDDASGASLTIIALQMGVVALTMIPGGAILLRQARSLRWRQAAVWLVTLSVVNVGVLLALTVVESPQTDAAEPASVWVAGLQQADSVLGWLELWWITVLVAEFAILCRAYALVQATERLGVLLMCGLAFNAALIGWIVPRPESADHPGTITLLLALPMFVLLLTAVGWALHLLITSAMLARFLAEACGRREAARDDRESP